MATLEKVTRDSEHRVGQGDYLVSPFTPVPFAALRVTEVMDTSKRVWVRMASMQGRSQLPGGWVMAADFWFPPKGYRWSAKGRRWETGSVEEPTAWKDKPTLEELGLTRDADGWLVPVGTVTEPAPFATHVEAVVDALNAENL